MTTAHKFIHFWLVMLSWHLDAHVFKSPCPDVFHYQQRDDSTDRWYGLMNLESRTNVVGVTVTITLDNPAIVLGNLLGIVTTHDYREYIIRSDDFELKPNHPHLMRFYVGFNLSKPIPKLIKIQQNKETICLSAKQMKTLDRAFTSVKIPDELPETTNEGINGCGRPDVVAAEPLRRKRAVGGENSAEGEWPWHVALYKNDAGNIKYICGGSLISDRIIVTVAQCVVDPYSGDSLSASKFLVYLGVARLIDFGKSLQTTSLSRIIVHPDYSIQNFHNDIAIFKTERKVEFTFYVKPICLWVGDDNLNGIIGKLGTVVGWGIDKSDHLSVLLQKTKMPVVDTLECIYSKPDFFGKYTSLKSFCAGFRNGSGACNGDSGSALVISEKDASDNKMTWYIRGLVSVSVKRQDKDICDLSHYLVFTDVAKHVPWILKTIDNI